MKIYIKSAADIKSGSYMLSKDGDLIEVNFHAPSTTYIDREIYHLCPTDANFLMNQGKISEDDGEVILKYCFSEFLDDKNVDGDYEITSSDVRDFANYADLLSAPKLYRKAKGYVGKSFSELSDGVDSFESLSKKWYNWLKNNFVKVSMINNKVEFRIGSDNGYDWNDVIIDDVILKSSLKDNPNMRYNILRESSKGYKAYFKDATLNDILEDDKVVLSSKNLRRYVKSSRLHR